MRRRQGTKACTKRWRSDRAKPARGTKGRYIKRETNARKQLGTSPPEPRGGSLHPRRDLKADRRATQEGHAPFEPRQAPSTPLHTTQTVHRFPGGRLSPVECRSNPTRTSSPIDRRCRKSEREGGGGRYHAGVASLEERYPETCKHSADRGREPLRLSRCCAPTCAPVCLK